MAPSDNRLAIHGGAPMVPEGPPSWPRNDPTILAALQDAYRTGMWGQYHGEAYALLVESLCEFTGSSFAWPCASGTIAVELALRGLKVGPGDEVLIAGYDFPGNFRAIESVGATPVLVDLVPDSWRIDLSQLDDAVGPATKAVIASHLHGELVAMSALCDWAAQRGVEVIEDACQCPGALVEGRIAGGWGAFGVLSFGGSKLLTSGRGGALVTNRGELYQRVKIAAERGNDAFPLSELQATVLLPQLRQLQAWNELRHNAALNLQQQLNAFDNLVVGPTQLGEASNSRTTFYKFPLRLPAGTTDSARQSLIAAVQAEGIALDVGFRGFVRRSIRRCRRPMPLVEAQAAADRTVLLHHPVLLAPPDQLERTAAGLQRVLRWWLDSQHS